MNPLCTANIKHVVVLMMENRSFDHLLGDFRRIDGNCDGIDPAAPGSNLVPELQAAPFTQQAQNLAKLDMWLDNNQNVPFDPKHEFVNVQRQIVSVAQPAMSGFARDVYASFRDENYQSVKTPYKERLPELVQSVMNYIPFGADAASDPLPGIQGLARQFTVCDRWFSSLPGPTWPNRFFTMMGSAHGRVLMPSDWKDTLKGISNFSDHACKESIFSLLAGNGREGRVYADSATPLAFMAKGCGTRFSMAQFNADVANDNLPDFAWIEPDFSYEGSDGNSQHPPENLTYGDAFISRVFNSLAGSPAWQNTVFVLLYDEHGGFYDHVLPPATVAPDNFSADVTVEGSNQPFDFTRLGVRVPAIIASPWTQRTVDKTDCYDHTSLLAFTCDLFGLPRTALGQRVAQARHFGDAPIWADRRLETQNLQLRQVATPKRSRALTQYETGLAAENRKLIQGMHAYLSGGDVSAAMSVASGAPTRGMLRAPLPRLEDMVEEIRGKLTGAAAAPPGLRTLAEASFVQQAAGEKLRLLCLHGVGHGDAASGWQTEPGWQDRWRQVIESRLAAQGIPAERIEIRWFAYDQLFGSGPNGAQILRGLAGLLSAGVDTPTRGLGASLPIGEILRWTAGMAIQWMEDLDLRDQLCASLQAEIKAFQPQGILGHSLGSLIAYDCLRRSVVQGGDALDAVDGRVFASFGSQIAHPLVIREAWGGRLVPLNAEGRGVAQWFNLYNPHDKVLTCPITLPDPLRVDVLTDFDIPLRADWLDLDHAGEAYLGDRATDRSLWPRLASLAGGTRRAPVVMSRGVARRQRALLVGINAYPDPAMALNGCVNDVFLMSKTLQQSGYDPSDIRLLLDERATRSEIVSRLDWLVEGARPGDERVFFYSGHGAQIPAYGDTGEPDKMDETLVPYDFDWDDEQTHFTDKQFNAFYSHLPFTAGDDPSASVFLTAIFDCCHAGGMTRGGGHVRGISPPPDIRHRMLRWDEELGEWGARNFAQSVDKRRAHAGDGAPSSANARSAHGMAGNLRTADVERATRLAKVLGHAGPYMPLLLYAARESELANEYEHGAVSYGAFTFALVEQINRVRKAKRATDRPLSFLDLIDRRVKRSLAARDFAQTPEVVGPDAVMKRAVPWLKQEGSASK